MFVFKVLWILILNLITCSCIAKSNRDEPAFSYKYSYAMADGKTNHEYGSVEKVRDLLLSMKSKSEYRGAGEKEIEAADATDSVVTFEADVVQENAGNSTVVIDNKFGEEDDNEFQINPCVVLTLCGG